MLCLLYLQLNTQFYYILGRVKRSLHFSKKLQETKEAWREIKREIQDISDDTASIEAIYKEQTSNSKQILELKKAKVAEAEEMKELKIQVTTLNEKMDAIHSMLKTIAK